MSLALLSVMGSSTARARAPKPPLSPALAGNFIAIAYDHLPRYMMRRDSSLRAPERA